jgi:hypothetical protein
MRNNMSYLDLGYDDLLSRATSVITLFDEGITSENADALIMTSAIGFSKTTMGTLETNQNMKSSNFVTGSAGWQILGSGDVEFNSGTFRGSLIAGSIDIPDTTTANSFHVDTSGNAWWGATAIGSATAKVLNTGAATFTSITITGGSVDWSTINDDDGNKPDNNATLGATFGTNIAGGGTDNTQVTNTGYATLFREDKFGDGNDGDVTISSNTSLTADAFYNNLTVNTGITLTTNGFRLFVKGTLTLTGTGKVARNGNAGGNGTNATSAGGSGAGTGGTAGTALADGSVIGAVAGIVGANGRIGASRYSTGTTGGSTGTAGGAGNDVAKSIGTTGSNSVAGGAGGTGTTSESGTGGSGSGGSGGAGGAKTGTVFNQVRSIMAAYLLYDIIDGDNLRSSPSSGGAGSGGTGGLSTNGTNPYAAASSGSTGGAGGGGSTGGICCVFAKILAGSGTIEAKGGTGGNAGTTFASSAACSNPYTSAAGGSGGSSGGNGGTGGVVIIAYETNSGTVTFSASGGSGGTKSSGSNGAHCGTGTSHTSGSDGTDGSNGAQGVTIELTT